MKKLTHTEFKVYVCLLFNKDGYTIDFSPAYIHELSGLNQDTIRKAFNALIDKGFLIKANDKETLFNFYETPQKRINNEKREIIDKKTPYIRQMSVVRCFQYSSVYWAKILFNRLCSGFFLSCFQSAFEKAFFLGRSNFHLTVESSYI